MVNYNISLYLYLLIIHVSLINTIIVGIGFMILAPICLFIAVQLMFEIRESEKRRGVIGNNF
jgi:type III secretory pathway component EscR